MEKGIKVDGFLYFVGVIDLLSFYFDMEGVWWGFVDFKSIMMDVRKILEDFKVDNVDVVVLDLCCNGGGSFIEVINCIGLFIDVGLVV